LTFEARAIGVHGGVNLGTMPAGSSIALGFAFGVQHTFSLSGFHVVANAEFVKRSYNYVGTAFGTVTYTPSYYVIELPLLLKIGDGKSLPALLIGPDPQLNISSSCSSASATNGCSLRPADLISFSVQGGLTREFKIGAFRTYLEGRYSYQLIGPSSTNSNLKLNGFMFLAGVDF